MFVKDIINVTNGNLISGDINCFIDSFSIDSRTINENDLFIAINGDNFDGNNFIKDAIFKGAIGVIYQGNIDKDIFENDKIIIQVNDTISALQEMARFKREQYDIPVVAITGSVGKTSTKDLVASVMSQKYNVLKTEGNFNNHIGLPLTLLKLKDHDAMCIEVGMNHFNELRLLTNILKPTICVITNVGTAHIGNLGSRENILKAKLELLEGMNDGIVVINNDNDLLHDWYLKQNIYKVKTYGIDNESDYVAQNINYYLNESTFSTNLSNDIYNVKVPGKHFVYNSLCALTIGKLLNIDEDLIKRGILNFELTKGRMEERKIDNNIILLVDCYNANYDSMVSAIDVLSKYDNRTIAVLGDMLELGEYSIDLHKKVGEYLNDKEIDILVAIGSLSKNISEKFNGKVYNCVNNDEAVKLLRSIIKSEDVILFKASNAMNFIEIVNNL